MFYRLSLSSNGILTRQLIKKTKPKNDESQKPEQATDVNQSSPIEVGQSITEPFEQIFIKEEFIEEDDELQMSAEEEASQESVDQSNVDFVGDEEIQRQRQGSEKDEESGSCESQRPVFTCAQSSHKTKLSASSNRNNRRYKRKNSYKCEYCVYTTSYPTILKNHIRTHTGEKPFKCDICDYKCAQSGSMKYHIRTHTGERNFKCEFCDYRSYHLGNLKSHIRTHTGEKPFKCDHCEYRCTQLFTLKNHIRIHKGLSNVTTKNVLNQETTLYTTLK